MRYSLTHPSGMPAATQAVTSWSVAAKRFSSQRRVGKGAFVVCPRSSSQWRRAHELPINTTMMVGTRR